MLIVDAEICFEGKGGGKICPVALFTGDSDRPVTQRDAPWLKELESARVDFLKDDNHG